MNPRTGEQGIAGDNILSDVNFLDPSYQETQLNILAEKLKSAGEAGSKALYQLSDSRNSHLFSAVCKKISGVHNISIEHWNFIQPDGNTALKKFCSTDDHIISLYAVFDYATRIAQLAPGIVHPEGPMQAQQEDEDLQKITSDAKKANQYLIEIFIKHAEQTLASDQQTNSIGLFTLAHQNTAFRLLLEDMLKHPAYDINLSGPEGDSARKLIKLEANRLVTCEKFQGLQTIDIFFLRPDCLLDGLLNGPYKGDYLSELGDILNQHGNREFSFEGKSGLTAVGYLAEFTHDQELLEKMGVKIPENIMSKTVSPVKSRAEAASSSVSKSPAREKVRELLSPAKNKTDAATAPNTEANAVITPVRTTLFAGDSDAGSEQNTAATTAQPSAVSSTS